ncbi:MAG: DUF262 domain-containing protein [Spirochaetaceae bacterium]|nr:DUF262 domain-containing protein [Spirochaetaceae bacterium]
MNLESLSKVFGGKIFYIPDYQRGYSWDKEQRDDLLEDTRIFIKAGLSIILRYRLPLQRRRI